MVDIQSKEIIDKMAEELKVQPSLALPRKLMDSIQPVFNVNPQPAMQQLGTAFSDGTAGTLMTTSTTKRTFVTAVNYTVTKDVVNTSINTRIGATLFLQNAQINLLRTNYEPVTAGSFTETITFNPPLEMAKGIDITLNNSSGLASIDSAGVVFFYELDPL